MWQKQILQFQYSLKVIGFQRSKIVKIRLWNGLSSFWKAFSQFRFFTFLVYQFLKFYIREESLDPYFVYNGANSHIRMVNRVSFEKLY